MIRATMMTAGVCLLAVTGLMAQTHSSTRVKLPHAVTVGSVTLAPGEYTITDQEGLSGNTVLLLRSQDGASATVLATPVSEPTGRGAAESKVVLQRTGERYQLKTIWMQGLSNGYEIQQ